jgi:hypothetical protein
MSDDSRTSARAIASRRNGARSRGPKTVAGRARSSRNALKHGFNARRLLLLDDEDAAAFAAFEAAARAELAPTGVFQADLVTRIVAAAWRARRADRLEAALLGRYLADARPDEVNAAQTALGFGLMRDGNGPRALQTLVRYRAAVLAELFRGLGALKLLQAERQNDHAAGLPEDCLAVLPATIPETKRTRESTIKQRVDV